MNNTVEETKDERLGRGPNGRALVPFFFFIAFYLGAAWMAPEARSVPLTASVVVAVLFSLMLNLHERWDTKLEILCRGMGASRIMLFSLVLVLTGVFSRICLEMGATEAAVLLLRHAIPGKYMLAAFFLMSGFIGIISGSSIIPLACLIPVGVSMVAPLGLSPVWVCSSMIGGAMMSDTLSLISPSVLIASRTQTVDTGRCFSSHFFTAFPAILLTVCILACRGQVRSSSQFLDPVTFSAWVAILPFLTVLFLACFGMDPVFLLAGGICIGVIVGISRGCFDIWDALGFVGQGTMSMSGALVVVILVGGLYQLLLWNGGGNYLKLRFCAWGRSPHACEIISAFLMGSLTLLSGSNVISILLLGDSLRAQIIDCCGSRKRIVVILAGIGAAVQGLLPYGGQMLLSIGLGQQNGYQISPFLLMKYNIYCIVLFISVVIYVLFFGEGKYRGRKNMAGRFK